MYFEAKCFSVCGVGVGGWGGVTMVKPKITSLLMFLIELVMRGFSLINAKKAGLLSAVQTNTPNCP